MDPECHAYYSGYRAKLEGFESWHNPYSPESPMFTHWLNGFVDAMDDGIPCSVFNEARDEEDRPIYGLDLN